MGDPVDIVTSRLWVSNTPTEVAERVAMAVAWAYELSRGAEEVYDVHAGEWLRVDRGPHAALVATVFPTQPDVCSADLVSVGSDKVRIIEVKGRGGSGSIELPERELDTLRCAGVNAWLYVVWNVTQPSPVELWAVRDPGALDWVEKRAAERPLGTDRGVRHEAKFDLPAEVVAGSGEQIALPAAILEQARQLKAEAHAKGWILHAPR